MIFFDQTFPDDFAYLPNGPASTVHLTGMKFALWANQSLHSWWANNPSWQLGQPGMLAGPEDIARVATAFYRHLPLTINAGGDNFDIIPPKGSPYLFQIDEEGWSSLAANMVTPAHMKAVTTALKLAVPGIRLTTYVPSCTGINLIVFTDGMINDNWLKTETYEPDAEQIELATAYALKHKSWIDDLWAITVNLYFNTRVSDEPYMFWRMANYLRLLRGIFPTKRIIVETGGFREIEGSPVAEDDSLQRWASILRWAGVELDLYGVIIWGAKSLNEKLLNYLGFSL